VSSKHNDTQNLLIRALIADYRDDQTLEYFFLLGLCIVLYFTSVLKDKEFSTRVGAIVDRQKVLKQAGVVHTVLN